MSAMEGTAGSSAAVGTLEDAVALVTGGGKGIGQAAARRLAALGARVAILDLDAAAAEATAAPLPDALAVAADVGDYEAMRAAIGRVLQTCGRIDVLVNNAGIIRRAPAVDFSESDWNDVLRINLTVPFFLCQAEAMKRVAAFPI